MNPEQILNTFKILTLVFSILTLILGIGDIFAKTKRTPHRLKKITLILSGLTIISAFGIYYFDNIVSRKEKLAFEKYKIAVSDTLQMSNERISINNFKTAEAIAKSDSFNVQLRLAQLQIEKLRIQGIKLKMRGDSLYQISIYEKTARYIIETNTIENRKIYQYGPVVEDLKTIKDLVVNIMTIDNGEAINTRDRLITLFRFVGWKINKKGLYYDSEFEYLIPKTKRKKEYRLFEEGIKILYYSNFDEISKRLDSIRTSKNKYDLSELMRDSDSEIAAELLRKHLLAMGVYASSITSRFYDRDVKENEIFIFIGKRYSNEEEMVALSINHDEQLKKLRDFYKNSPVQIFNNKIIIDDQ